MPLHVRAIATNIAVVCFFAIGIIGWISGLSPFICCKRALIATVVTYVIATCAVRAINAILLNAMIESKMNQRKEGASDSGD